MKNPNPLLFLSLLMSLLFLFGCSMSNEEKQMNLDLIASEKTLPTNFHEIAFKRKEAPFFQYLVRKVVYQSEFAANWSFYGFESKPPSVNLNKKDVFFIGVQESGSCPYEIGNIKLSSDNKTMKVTLSEPDGACTSDATPRTFVLQIDKEIAKEMESVVIVQSGVETNILLD